MPGAAQAVPGGEGSAGLPPVDPPASGIAPAPDPQSVGVLGLGRMGLPIARRLAAAGYSVLAWDPAVGPELAAEGVVLASDAVEVAAAVDILLTVLPGAPEVERAMLEDGVLAALGSGTLWLDLTSNDPGVADRLAEAAAERGIEAVGAPMGGGVPAALAGELTFFVGGARSSVDRVLPLLRTIGTRVERAGEAVGDGHTAKLLVNLLWFGQVVAATEALLLGQSLGLQPAALREILRGSAAGSVFVEQHLGHLLVGDYLETFGIDRVVDELVILRSLADAADSPFELSALVTRMHEQALTRFGPVDGELFAAKLLEERAGRTLRG